jgi:hypothetical protein
MACSSLFGLLVLMLAEPSKSLLLWWPAAWRFPTIQVKTVSGHDRISASSHDD